MLASSAVIPHFLQARLLVCVLQVFLRGTECVDWHRAVQWTATTPRAPLHHWARSRGRQPVISRIYGYKHTTSL